MYTHHEQVLFIQVAAFLVFSFFSLRFGIVLWMHMFIYSWYLYPRAQLFPHPIPRRWYAVQTKRSTFGRAVD